MLCKICSYVLTISECCCNDNFCEFCIHPGICNICCIIFSDFSKSKFFIFVYKTRGISSVKKFAKILNLTSDELKEIYSILLFGAILNSKSVLELLMEGADYSFSLEINGIKYTSLDWAIYKKAKDTSYILQQWKNS